MFVLEWREQLRCCFCACDCLPSILKVTEMVDGRKCASNCAMTPLAQFASRLLRMLVVGLCYIRAGVGPSVPDFSCVERCKTLNIGKRKRRNFCFVSCCKRASAHMPNSTACSRRPAVAGQLRHGRRPCRLLDRTRKQQAPETTRLKH